MVKQSYTIVSMALLMLNIGWWTPQLRCQMYKFSCNDGKEQADFEKCVPWKVGDKAVGAQGVMVTGS